VFISPLLFLVRLLSFFIDLSFFKQSKHTVSFENDFEHLEYETTLLKKVDTLLYQAKHKGKKRVAF
jgi:PleD family two-component response regulator